MKGIIKRIRTLITGKPFFNVDIEHPIIPAFISGGVQYYMFEDIFNAPFQRSFEAQTFYTEMQMRVDKEYLQLHVQAMATALNSNDGIRITDIITLTNQLSERMEFIVDADLIYKLASVMYFDSNENPYKYDFAHGFKKIAKWKLENDVEDFFLNTPIKNFLPFLDMLEKDLESYLRVTEKIKKHHKSTISGILSKNKKKNGL